ncbi:MAG: ribulokinase [Bacteroidetes bacterium]|nr:MAG: ribulokinase [Bacteroidota bacterium]
MSYTIGVDYGTDSVRALVVDTRTGEEMGTHVFEYPRWKERLYCDPANMRFRQHPLDYLEGLEVSIVGALEQCGSNVAQKVVGISVDTTGSTPVAVNRQGIPLALLPGFEENPNAMFVLWKDHTALKEADEINALARSWGGTDYTLYEGGIYSSEWFWAKVLHVLREDKKVKEEAWSWVEHCDWIPGLLVGDTDPLKLKRSRCAAGHKAMWHESFGGLPEEEFLVKLDPLLEGLKERLFEETFSCEVKVGTLSEEWAGRLGLPDTVVVGAGAFDAHLGALGAEIGPYQLSKVMGTSTCDMIIAPQSELGDRPVEGICGQVDGSIVPGMVGLEAGQSAFGDIYAWFKDLLMWPLKNVVSEIEGLDEAMMQKILKESADKMIAKLSEAAAKINPASSSLLALDWMNGRRTPDANQNLKGAIMGLTLGTDAPAIFRALIEATAFGARMIVDRFVEEGIRIDEVIALGGVAKKSPLVMQIMADVLNKPIKVARSEQAVALGSAMAASVVAGVHDSIPVAQQAMGGGFETEYQPDPTMVQIYAELYERYKRFGQFVEGETL